MNEKPIEHPEVTQVRLFIEDTFSLHAGPISHDLAPKAYSEWVERGHYRISSLRRYVHFLAAYLPDSERRQAFIDEATMCIVTRSSEPKDCTRH